MPPRLRVDGGGSFRRWNNKKYYRFSSHAKKSGAKQMKKDLQKAPTSRVRILNEKGRWVVYHCGRGYSTPRGKRRRRKK